ncbi:MAG: hypothetical protein KJ025_12035 [Burkholderiales bacterium]|nr:hypothetical protein [Burkholderiales bacterium]
MSDVAEILAEPHVRTRRRTGAWHHPAEARAATVERTAGGRRRSTSERKGGSGMSNRTRLGAIAGILVRPDCSPAIIFVTATPLVAEGPPQSCVPRDDILECRAPYRVPAPGGASHAPHRT